MLTLTCEAEGLYPSVEREFCSKGVKKFWRKTVGVSTSFSEQGLSSLLFTLLPGALAVWAPSCEFHDFLFLPSLFLLKLYPSSAPAFSPLISFPGTADKPCAVESRLIQFLHRRNRYRLFLPLLKLVSIPAGTPRATAMCL